MNIKSSFNFKKAQQALSASYGRKPNTHWKLLLAEAAVLIVCAVAGGIFVFWWSSGTLSKELPTRESNRTFSKRQFELVLEYFNVRAKKFEEAKQLSVPTDPAGIR